MNNLIAKIPKLKSLSLYFFTSIITAVIGILINPFLSVGLNHKDFAILGYYSSFNILFMPLVSLVLSNFYARKYYLVDDNKKKEIYQTILSIYIIFGLLLLALLILVYYFYHKFFVSSIEFFPYAIMSFLPLYFSNFYNLYLLDLRMGNNAKRYSIISILNNLVSALLSLWWVYFIKYGAVGRLSAILITSILFGVFSMNVYKFKFKIDRTITREALSFSWPLVISAILTFFFMGVDRTFLEKLNDNYNLGLYNVGIQIAGYIGIFGSVLLQTFDPEIYKYSSRNEMNKVFQIIFLIIGLAIIPNVAFMFFSKYIIDFLTYGKYIEAANYANILCIKNVTTLFSFTISGVLISKGFSKLEMYNRFLGAFLSVIIFKVFIDNFGFYGAAWGQGISWLIMGVISLLTFYIFKKNET